MVTIITFVWEFSYIVNYDEISLYAKYLTNSKTHVWKNKYNLSYVLPWEMASIFYAEYRSFSDKTFLLAFSISSELYLLGTLKLVFGFRISKLLLRSFLTKNAFTHDESIAIK